MTDKTMTLEQVRDWHLSAHEKLRAQSHSPCAKHQLMADAIARHLSQPAERGEAVDRVAKAIADAAGHGMREKCEHMAHAAIAAYRLATWPETAPPPAVGVPDVVRKGFMTAEACGPGKHYVLKIKFQTLADLQDAHRAMLSATPSPAIDGAAVRDVVREIRRCAGNNNAKFHLSWADKLARAIGDAK